MNIYIYIYISIYIQINIQVYTYTHIYVHIYMHTNIHINIYIYIYHGIDQSLPSIVSSRTSITTSNFFFSCSVFFSMLIQSAAPRSTVHHSIFLYQLVTGRKEKLREHASFRVFQGAPWGQSIFFASISYGEKGEIANTPLSGSFRGLRGASRYFLRHIAMGWLRLVGSLKIMVSFAKEPYNRDDILQKRPIILRSLLIVAGPFWGKLRTCFYQGLSGGPVGTVDVCFMAKVGQLERGTTRHLVPLQRAPVASADGDGGGVGGRKGGEEGGSERKKECETER